MDITEVGYALSNETRVRILRLLETGPRSSIETYERYQESYDEDRHRETIYRELETFVEAGLLSKEYDEEAKQIEYRLESERLLLDLASGTVERPTTE